MKLLISKSSYASGESPYRRVRVTTPNMDKHSMARMCDAVAKDWGGINRQQTIYKDNNCVIKYYSCEGHGGFVMYTKQPIDNITTDLSYLSYNGWWGTFGERMYIYKFEEDCQWAQLYQALPDDLKLKYRNNWYTDPTSVEDLNRMAKESIDNYCEGIRIKLPYLFKTK